MRRARLTVLCTSVLLVLASCATPAGRTAGVRAGVSRATYERTVDELLPDLGAADTAAREHAHQALERLCLSVGDPQVEQDRALLCAVICERLEPTTALPARLWMLRQLEHIGRAECVPTLAGLLYGQDPQLREAARRALQCNPTGDAREVLRVALDAAEDEPRQVALAAALGARGDLDEPARSALRVLFFRGSEPAAEAGLAALGHDGSPEAAFFLQTLWRDGPNEVRAIMGGHGESATDWRPAVAAALLRCADRLLADGHTGLADQIFATLHGPLQDAQTRWIALRGLMRTRGPAMLPELLAIVADEAADPSQRREAAALLVEVPGPLAATMIAQRTTAGTPAAQALLLGALADRGDAPGRTVALSLASAASPEVRAAALQALQKLGDRTAVRVLVQAAAETEGAVRDAARASLARLAATGADEELLTGLQTAAPGERVEIVRALQARSCQMAIPMLLAEAGRGEDEVRSAAFDALGELAKPAQATQLVELLVRATGDSVGAAAENAVVAVLNRITDEAERARPLLLAWDAAPAGARPALVRALGRIGGPPALDLIRTARHSQDEAVMDAAVRALAKWPTDEVLDDLWGLAKHSPDKSHRVLALQGYARLLALPGTRSAAETLARYQTAMSLAERPEEKQLVLAGVAKVAHLDALHFAQQYLGDEALRAEAEAAVVAAARLVFGEHRADALTALEAVAATTAQDANREAAHKALDELRRTAGHITTWQVAGPYFEIAGGWNAAFETAYPPESAGASGVAWQPLAVTNTKEPWVFDLTKAYPGNDRCVYVRAFVWSASQQPAQLQVGSDDGVRAWVNGQLVHEFKGIRIHAAFQDHVPITLQAGWNTVLLKVVQGAGWWGFSGSVSGPDGTPLEGLKVQSEPPAT